MADEREKKGGKDLFRLGRGYDAVDPRLGRLYESWHVPTGRPALTLFPRDRVEWAPTEATEEVNNLFTLANAGLTRVEEDPRVRAHLSSAPVSQESRPWRMAMAMGLATLGLALGVWLHAASRPSSSTSPHLPVACECPIDGRAPLLTDSDTVVPDALAYPLPSKPFTDQAVVPCRPRRGEEGNQRRLLDGLGQASALSGCPGGVFGQMLPARGEASGPSAASHRALSQGPLPRRAVCSSP